MASGAYLRHIFRLVGLSPSVIRPVPALGKLPLVV